MTEQSPSAEALDVAKAHIVGEIYIRELAQEIDALCEQRVSAAVRHFDYAMEALDVIADGDGDPQVIAQQTVDDIRAPAERPAPPQQPIRERIERQRKIITNAEIKLATIRSECKHGDKYRNHNMDLICRDCGQRW
jgi:hypothetical protein